MSETLTFDALRAANVRRCEESFHPVADWSPTDWACAMAGEAGEACNEVKKLRRIARQPEDVDGGPHAAEYDLRIQAVAAEIADTIIYADLLAARLGVDLADAVARKFNVVSGRVHSTVLLRARGGDRG